MNVCAPPGLPRRHWLACGAAALLAPVLAACSAPLAPLRVGAVVFPGYEDLFLARELGLLDESRVRLVELLVNTDTLRALAAGQLEAAALTLDELMAARADGVDLRAVLVLDVADGADTVRALPGRMVDVLAVRADALQSHAAALRHLLQCHFAALALLRESPERCTPLMARRLQTVPSKVQALYRGLQLPDLAQNRLMLAAGGTVDQAAHALQQTLADPRFLPA